MAIDDIFNKHGVERPSCVCFETEGYAPHRIESLNIAASSVAVVFDMSAEKYQICEKARMFFLESCVIAMLSSDLEDADQGMDTGLEKSLARVRGIEVRVEKLLRAYYATCQADGVTAKLQKLTTEGEA